MCTRICSENITTIIFHSQEYSIWTLRINEEKTMTAMYSIDLFSDDDKEEQKKKKSQKSEWRFEEDEVELVS